MAISVQLRPTKPPLRQSFFAGDIIHAGRRRFLRPRPNNLATISFSLQSHSETASPSTSEPSHSHCHFTTSSLVASSLFSPPHFNLTHRHITILNLLACFTAISATWLFCSAIPALLAFKKAAESMEKLMDSTREELPDTMAAIRLSGMEINDLTTELSDLGQEITKGVRNSTSAVRVAEDRVRGFTTMAPSVSSQAVPRRKDEPVVARTARGLREGLEKGRTIMQMFFTFIHISKIALNYYISRRRKS